ncbi:unnamed protein product [Rhizopus stolonifer]
MVKGGSKDCIDYLERMIDNEGEYWVGVHVNKYMHMNNRSSNRVEGTHAAQKFHLKSSVGKMALVTNKVDQWYKTRVKRLTRQNKRLY